MCEGGGRDGVRECWDGAGMEEGRGLGVDSMLGVHGMGGRWGGRGVCDDLLEAWVEGESVGECGAHITGWHRAGKFQKGVRALG